MSNCHGDELCNACARPQHSVPSVGEHHSGHDVGTMRLYIIPQRYVYAASCIGKFAHKHTHAVHTSPFGPRSCLAAVVTTFGYPRIVSCLSPDYLRPPRDRICRLPRLP